MRGKLARGGKPYAYATTPMPSFAWPPRSPRNRHAWAIDRADRGARPRPMAEDQRMSIPVEWRGLVHQFRGMRPPRSFRGARCGLRSQTAVILDVWNMRALRIAADRVGGICTQTDEVTE